LKKIAENAPLSVRGTKITIEAILEDGGVRQKERMRQLALEAFESRDYKEGTQAFLEKRPPRFEGR
jgi:enoyl-CoA hydratase/carnithine racemase